MNTRHLLSYLICTLVLGVASVPATGAVAVAKGEHGYTYTVTEAIDNDKATEMAIQGCSQHDTNCQELVWQSKPGAVAIVRSAGGLVAAVVHEKPEVARAQALSDCKKHDTGCRFVEMHWEPGVRWYAGSIAKDKDGAVLSVYFSPDNATREIAEQDAIEHCNEAQRKKGRTEPCESTSGVGQVTFLLGSVTSSDGKRSAPITFFGAGGRTAVMAQGLAEFQKNYPGARIKLDNVVENPGPQPEPKNYKAVVALVEQPMAQDAARRVRAVNRSVDSTSCTNDCTNGSCLRRFPNGRTERWEAPRVFDPSTNNWKWDTITNACGQ